MEVTEAWRQFQNVMFERRGEQLQNMMFESGEEQLQGV